jgi:hypothetical protein
MQKQGESRWLGAWSRHALPTVLAGLTVAGVAGYAVGRAYLEGWYTAAGISPLAFSWEVQYVVLRGLSSDVLLLWIGGLGTISALILLGEFNPSSQHVLHGGVDEREEEEGESVPAREVALTGTAAGVALRRPLAVLAGDCARAQQRGRGRSCWSVDGRWHSMVPTMRWYATIASCTVSAAADRPLPFLRRA